MRICRQFLIFLVGASALAMVSSSCLTSGGGTQPDPENLSKQLLDVTDLESEWNETQRQVFTTRSEQNPSIDPSAWCPDAAQVTEPLVGLAGDSGADVEMEFKGLSGSARLLRQQAWSNENARAYFDTVFEAAAMCDGKTWTEEPGTTSAVALIPDTDLGDESVAWSTSMAPPSGAAKEKYASVGRVVVVRIQDVIVVLQVGDFAPEGSTNLLGLDDWKDLAGQAVDKFEKVDWK